ncbi:MAG: hypothetical protein AAF541_09285 [Pseudomonadota bacterium]
MSASDDLESHSWPGFVDILSAAIMMFVFFVLVTALALFIQVITFTSKEDPISALDVQQQQISDLEVENRELRESLAGLQQKIKETDATFSESAEDQKLHISDDGLSLVVVFGPTSITLTDDSDKRLREFAANVLSRYNPNRLSLQLSSSKSTSPIETIARKIAVARMFNVRNAFINSELPKDKLRMDVVEPTKLEGTYEWTKVQFKVD